MICQHCGALTGCEEAEAMCPSYENEAMVPHTYEEIYNTHKWVKEWPHSEVDDSCSEGANLQHMKFVLEGYRDRVIDDPHGPGGKYSPGSARDISWTIGWKKADEDLKKPV